MLVRKCELSGDITHLKCDYYDSGLCVQETVQFYFMELQSASDLKQTLLPLITIVASSL